MKSRVTTTKGDRGTTRTLAGDIFPKSHIILECTGAVDALRAQTALLRLQMIHSELPDRQELAQFLFWLLHTYFLIGTAVNDPTNKHPEYRKDSISQKHLHRLEAEQSRLEATLHLPKAFIVCASTAIAAQADVTATVARDVERQIVHLNEAEPAFEVVDILPFINRLSDYLYVLARHLEHGQHQPVDYSVLEP
ncbi:MAG: ATP:cob(I)alamin adenosyltransferase [Candidatus Hydrogenedentes bacterium]|nr:ATP:cob(I)alamin adenosyltransferase [Candidatus Hydrogenedentota bacterium]